MGKKQNDARNFVNYAMGLILKYWRRPGIEQGFVGVHDMCELLPQAHQNEITRCNDSAIWEEVRRMEKEGLLELTDNGGTIFLYARMTPKLVALLR